MRRVVLLLGLVLASVWLRPRATAARAQFVHHLPGALAGVAAEVVPPTTVEESFARSSRVSLTKRRYGPTSVSLIETVDALKEHHPPMVCLSAAGYNLEKREELVRDGRCLVHARLRRDREVVHLLYGYYDGARTSCSFAGRVAAAMWGRLIGAPTRSVSIQVLDRQPKRAQQIANALYRALERRGVADE